MTNARLPFSGSCKTYGLTTATTKGIQVGTAFTQLVAATDYDINGLTVMGYNDSGSNVNQAALTIGVGGAGAERSIVSGLIFPRLYTSASNDSSGLIYRLPLKIPRGSRIAAKSSSGIESLNVAVIGETPGPLCDSLGFDVGIPEGFTTNHGVTVDPGATANQLGSWAELTAACQRAYGAIMVQIGSFPKTGSDTSQQIQVDIGIGAGGSEQLLINGLFARAAHSGIRRVFPCIFGPFYVNIPAGARIAARARSSDNAAGTRVCDVTVIGFAR